jgi:hypothetical protein
MSRTSLQSQFSPLQNNGNRDLNPDFKLAGWGGRDSRFSGIGEIHHDAPWYPRELPKLAPSSCRSLASARPGGGPGSHWQGGSSGPAKTLRRRRGPGPLPACPGHWGMVINVTRNCGPAARPGGRAGRAPPAWAASAIYGHATVPLAAGHGGSEHKAAMPLPVHATCRRDRARGAGTWQRSTCQWAPRDWQSGPGTDGAGARRGAALRVEARLPPSHRKGAAGTWQARP